MFVVDFNLTLKLHTQNAVLKKIIGKDLFHFSCVYYIIPFSRLTCVPINDNNNQNVKYLQFKR